MLSPEVTLLLQILDEAYEKPAWHGPNLRNSIRRVPIAEASWRPASDQPNIWEIAVHAAYWKYVVWRRLSGAKRGSFPRKGSDWFARPAEDADWGEDVALLDEMHRKLRGAVAEITTEQLALRPLLSGVAAHDVYHAGQIQMLRRLFKRAAACVPEPPPG
jgi:uncharacterized damage-inducible protein DinB